VVFERQQAALVASYKIIGLAASDKAAENRRGIGRSADAGQRYTLSAILSVRSPSCGFVGLMRSAIAGLRSVARSSSRCSRSQEDELSLLPGAVDGGGFPFGIMSAESGCWYRAPRASGFVSLPLRVTFVRTWLTVSSMMRCNSSGRYRRCARGCLHQCDETRPADSLLDEFGEVAFLALGRRERCVG